MATMTTEALRLPGGARGFSLPATLDGGQAFRWRLLDDGSWEGVAWGRYLRLEARGEDLFLSPAGRMPPSGGTTLIWTGTTPPSGSGSAGTPL